ncbi:MAG: PrsW family intramembrane metalloprotease [Bacteroidales bacterium]|nr:PrsW family intramembrane metalloprotease [Bacteroidales bacterium]
MNIAFITAILPVLLLLYFVYRKDSLNPEPTGKLLLTFFVGCLSVIPAILLEYVLGSFQPSGQNYPLLSGVFNGYIVAGFSEELCKLLLLCLVIWRSPHFDEYYDGILYAAFLSLGFACVENIAYVYGSSDSLSVAIMRGLLAVPAHFLFAVAMGYHLSLAKFDPAHRTAHFWHAFIYPVLLHGTYDTLLMVSSNLSSEGDIVSGLVSLVLLLLFIVFDIRMWKWGMKHIKAMQQRSNEQDFNPTDPFSNFTWNF